MPCRAEAPILAVSRPVRAAGVSFLGVDVRDTTASAEAFVHSFDISYPSVNDASSSVTLDFSSAVPIAGTPTTLVIDRTGHIAGAVFGSITYPRTDYHPDQRDREGGVTDDRRARARDRPVRAGTRTVHPRPGPGPASPGTFGLADWLKWVWRQLTSMRIALILLFLLALGSVPGSVLPQQGTNPAGVQQYFTSHKTLAPLLNHVGLFNVFGAPWFAAIYLLLFASLVGCVVPRTFRLALGPDAAAAGAALPDQAAAVGRVRHDPAARAGGRGGGPGPGQPRVPAPPPSAGGTRDADPASAGEWVSAEKGYLREVGNLLFHLALLGVLVSVALGGLFGYKADRLLVQGTSFADTASALDEFYPGRFVTHADLAPFT